MFKPAIFFVIPFDTSIMKLLGYSDSVVYSYA